MNSLRKQNIYALNSPSPTLRHQITPGILKFMRTFYFILMLLFASQLVGCAEVAPAPLVAENKNISWNDRAKNLADLHAWHIKGALGVRTPQESWTASVQWQQQDATHYTVSLFGPLGTGAAKLTGAPQSVTLESGNGQTIHAKSPEELLTKQAGWVLPVSHLYYWVRGLPVPGIPADKTFDESHRLTLLKQQGWTIQYLRYTSVHQLDVPSKIFLDNAQLNVKLVINQWQF